MLFIIDMATFFFFFLLLSLQPSEFFILHRRYHKHPDRYHFLCYWLDCQSVWDCFCCFFLKRRGYCRSSCTTSSSSSYSAFILGTFFKHFVLFCLFFIWPFQRYRSFKMKTNIEYDSANDDGRCCRRTNELVVRVFVDVDRPPSTPMKWLMEWDWAKAKRKERKQEKKAWWRWEAGEK